MYRKHLVSEAEHDLAYVHIDPNGQGIGFYTKIGGYAGSSTRTELAAAILAISAHGPVHFASDSQAMVKKANFFSVGVPLCNGVS